jgi:uncharacterized C2H2 Zn-finger protein
VQVSHGTAVLATIDAQVVVKKNTGEDLKCPHCDKIYKQV